MIYRESWTTRLLEGWRHRPVVWLAGVRRTGKTTLARMLSPSVYLNCDLPSSIRRLENPELFFGAIAPGTIVILDEVHRLADPSNVLKIAADTFPSLRILATGSSSLAATRKFRDSLTGRKSVVHLPPVLWPECQDGFGAADLDRRLLRGGLPEMLLADEPRPEWYAEWLDSFYARDVQELFGIRERTGFLNLLRLMLRQSGGLADYTALSRECDLSRPTVKAHLEAMSVAYALLVVPPFHGGGKARAGAPAEDLWIRHGDGRVRAWLDEPSGRGPRAALGASGARRAANDGGRWRGGVLAGQVGPRD
jgi:predicted AAA+ superfamily ATPase